MTNSSSIDLIQEKQFLGTKHNMKKEEEENPNRGAALKEGQIVRKQTDKTNKYHRHKLK